jgi:hypothetical protein
MSQEAAAVTMEGWRFKSLKRRFMKAVQKRFGPDESQQIIVALEGGNIRVVHRGVSVLVSAEGLENLTKDLLIIKKPDEC